MSYSSVLGGSKGVLYGSLLLFIVTGIYGIGLGLGEDPDSELIYQVSSRLASGDIVPSRSLGFPFYEIPASYIIQYGSVVLANVATFVTSLLFIFFIYLLTRNTKNATFAFATIAVSPLVLVNNSVIMDTMQGLLFYVASIWALKRFFLTRGNFDLALLSIFIYLAIMTRPDYVILAFACCFLLLAGSEGRKRELLKIVLYMSFGAVACYKSYEYIYGTFSLPLSAPIGDGTLRKLARGFLGVINLYTPIGVLVLAYLVASNFALITSSVKRFKKLDFYARFFIVVAPLYFLRFLALPDELEYILPLFVSTVLCSSNLNLNRKALYAFALSIFISNFIHISFFKRDMGGLSINIQINKGSLLQDIASREFKAINRTDSFQKYLLGNLNFYCPTCNDRKIDYKIFGAGYETEESRNITDQFNAHVINNSRFGNSYRGGPESLICMQPVRTHRGWRLFQPSKNYEDTLSRYRSETNLECDFVKASTL